VECLGRRVGGWVGRQAGRLAVFKVGTKLPLLQICLGYSLMLLTITQSIKWMHKMGVQTGLHFDGVKPYFYMVMNQTSFDDELRYHITQRQSFVSEKKATLMASFLRANCFLVKISFEMHRSSHMHARMHQRTHMLTLIILYYHRGFYHHCSIQLCTVHEAPEYKTI